MDISQQGVAETGTLHLKSAKGEHMYDKDGKPVRVIVYGPGSEKVAAVETRQTQRSLKRAQDNDGKATVASPEKRFEEAVQDLCDVTHSFENMSYGDKTGSDLIRAVYSDRRLGFIGNQVNRFVNDWGNFAGNSIAA